jgi:predicted nucleotidyltransferase
MGKNKQSTINRLHSKGLIKPPSYVLNPCYETIMGSFAYGVSGDSSDCDICGFCIPPKDVIFPHLAGHIYNFGRKIQNFEQYQQHHIIEKDTRKEYDIAIYNIVKYFQLCMENNPNMIDSLYTPQHCIIFADKVANMVRDNRKLFLHKGSWHKFKGYAYSQMHKMRIKEPAPTSVRYKSIMKYGYDVKFAYHVVRLLNEVEQILIENDIDLMRNNDQLKSIRAGEWKIEDIEAYFNDKEKSLEKLYIESKLPPSPDEKKIKNLLLTCLEERYGNLEDCIINTDRALEVINQIKEIIYKNNL